MVEAEHRYKDGFKWILRQLGLHNLHNRSRPRWAREMQDLQEIKTQLTLYGCTKRSRDSSRYAFEMLETEMVNTIQGFDPAICSILGEQGAEVVLSIVDSLAQAA